MGHDFVDAVKQGIISKDVYMRKICICGFSYQGGMMKSRRGLVD